MNKKYREYMVFYILCLLSVFSFVMATALYTPLIVTQEQYEEEQKISDVPNILDLINQIINEKYVREYLANYVPPKKVWRAGGAESQNLQKLFQ